MVRRPGLEPGTSGSTAPIVHGSRKVSKRKVIHVPSACLQITEGLIDEFTKWVMSERPGGLGADHLKRYRNYSRRLVGLELCGKESVSGIFKGLGLNKASYEVFRRFIMFLD